MIFYWICEITLVTWCDINKYPYVLVIVSSNRNKRVADAIAAHQPTVRYLIKEWPNYLSEPTSGWADAISPKSNISIDKTELKGSLIV